MHFMLKYPPLAFRRLMMYAIVYNFLIPCILCHMCTAEFSAETIKNLLLQNRYVLQHWDESGIVLNDIQTKTLMSALMNRFQLIQGPPGMCCNTCECLKFVVSECCY